MSRDLSDFGDTIGSALGQIARSATSAASQNGHGRASGRSGNGALSGMRGVIAGAALAAGAPLAAKEAQIRYNRCKSSVIRTWDRLLYSFENSSGKLEPRS